MPEPEKTVNGNYPDSAPKYIEFPLLADEKKLLCGEPCDIQEEEPVLEAQQVG